MRWPGIVGFVACLGACLGACQDERNGAYLIVDGAAVPPFDHVTFFFGTRAEVATLVVSPLFATPTGDHQYLFERSRVATDVQPAPDSSLTYYLDRGSRDLGSYAIAIASAGGQPVGIAELIDFEVSSDAAYIYTLALVSYDQREVQRWGRSPAFDDDECVRWTRLRAGDDTSTGPSSFVIGRDRDRDCDGFTDHDADCDPHAYCDPEAPGSTCASGTCLIDGPPCQLGLCTNQDGVAAACTPVACLVQEACDACPPGDGAPGERATCAVLSSASHLDVDIVTNGDGTLCSHPYTFWLTMPDGTLCTDPDIALAMSDRAERPLEFGFAVVEDQGACKVTITELVAGARFTDAVPHLVITFGGGFGVGPRASFVVGLTVESGACDGVRQPLQSPLGFCGPR